MVYKKYRWRNHTYQRSRFSQQKKRSLVAAVAAPLLLVLAAAGLVAFFRPAPSKSAIPSPTAAEPSSGIATQAAAAREDDARTVRISAVGDVLLSRKIEATIAAEGWGAPFRNAKAILDSPDIAFCNLETTAALTGEPFPGKDPDVTFRAPPAALFGLKDAGFSVVSIANNHINDYGPSAVKETVAELDLLGIAHCGAGGNAEEAGKPAVLTSKGVRFAFIGYAEAMWSVIEAGEDAGVVILDKDRIIADIAAAKKIADVVVVSLHWGEEHQGRPRDSDRELARAIIDAGASMIVGHHPHVLQGAEFYRGGLILYSLGNFIFDMISARTYESAAAVVSFRGTVPSEVRFRPILIDRDNYAPSAAEGESALKIATLIRERCSYVDGEASIEADGAVVLRNPAFQRSAPSRLLNSAAE